jgi:hypothetical protein
MAVAHSLLIAIYFVLSGNDFKDLGADYYNQFNREKKIYSHLKQLAKLGFIVTDDMKNAIIQNSIPDDVKNSTIQNSA